MKKSIYEIALHLECLCTGVKCERYSIDDVTDVRIRKIIALAAKNDFFYESLCILCRDIAQGHCKIDSTSVGNYYPLWHVQSGNTWRWFRTYPEAIQLAEQAITQHATLELLQNFKLEHFVVLALEQEFSNIFQLVKTYVLDVYHE